MKRFPLILFFTMIITFSSYSQTDSVSVTNSPKDSIDSKYDRIYKLFIDDKKEVNHLWKVNLVYFSFTAPNLVYEQKIGKSFSSESALKIGITDNYNHFEYYSFGCLISEEIKYYYNLKHREKKGKRVNGFNGNYFSLTGFYGYAKYKYPTSDLVGGSSVSERKLYGYRLSYGLQRRIGNIGYIEPYLSIGYTWGNYYNLSSSSFDPTIGLKAGFAIDSFKSLKKYRNLR